MNRISNILIAIAVLAASTIGGCAGSIIPGLRLAPDESQKQAADAADTLAGRLVSTGTRPGSPAALALSRMTRPAATYAGPPAEPIDLESLIQVEAGQWRHKDDQVAAAMLRDDLRRRAMQITITHLTDLSTLLAEKDVAVSAVLNRFAAVATVAQMADELADVIPDPKSPDETRSPEIDRIAAKMSEAAKTLSALATAAAVKRPDAGTVIDKTLDAAGRTLDKARETKERVLSMVEEYAPEAAAILGIFGLGIGGYAVKKRKDAKVAQDGQNEVKIEAERRASADEITSTIVERVVEALKPEKPQT